MGNLQFLPGLVLSGDLVLPPSRSRKSEFYVRREEGARGFPTPFMQMSQESRLRAATRGQRSHSTTQQLILLHMKEGSRTAGNELQLPQFMCESF